MKVLVLNGSPRSKGSNTIKIAHAFVDGMQDAIKGTKANGLKATGSKAPGAVDNVIIDELDVISKKIGPCRGCFSCWTKSPGSCVIRDDMTDILERIKAADVVVWSFPLYYFGIPSHLKALMDRMLPLNLPEMGPREDGGISHFARYDLSRQRQVLISTSGFPSVRNNYEALLAQFSILFGKDGFTPIICPEGELFSVPQLRSQTDAYLSLARDAGRQFTQDGKISPSTEAGLSTLMFGAEAYARMANADWDIADSTANSAADLPADSPANQDAAASRDEQFAFLEQMASLYNPAPLEGKRVIMEMYFSDLGKAYRLYLEKEQCTVRPASESGEAEPYTVRIETPWHTWLEISSGMLDGAKALMDGKYRVLGDFGFMMKIDNVFASGPADNDTFDLHAMIEGKAPGSSQGLTPNGKTAKKANMTVLLIPWIVAWIFIPINPRIGALASVFAAGLLPLAALKWRSNAYEAFSGAFLVCLSISILLGLDGKIAVPASYAAFGLMWLASCLTRTPLTAFYSAEGYGGESALNNVLFMKTNVILTFAWGVLYAVTAVWTAFLMRTPAASFVGLINNACPALMGVFTAWFQKWYPAHVASR